MAEIPKGDFRDKNYTMCCYVMFILEKQFETISSSTLVEAYRYLNYKKKERIYIYEAIIIVKFLRSVMQRYRINK
jgi:hypothetical protein